MDLYELLVVLHVFSVIIWLGAAFVLSMLIVRSELANDAAMKAELNGHAEWLAVRLFVPASMATLLFGVLGTIDGPWGFDQLWVVLGLAGWLASFGVGIGYFKPEGERIGALVEARGFDAPEVASRLDRMELVGRVELTVLFLVAADMVIKPTGDDTGVLIAMAAILLGITSLLVTRARA